MGKNVLVVGSGGREHAIVWKLAQSSRVEEIYAAPGNAGTDQIAENVPIAVTDITGLADFAKKKKIDLTIVGGEDPLAAGIVDRFLKQELPIVGPTQAAGKIEFSKVYAKLLMESIGIPTAPFQVFDNIDEAFDYARNQPLPVVVKEDGLAHGKGTFVCKSTQQIQEALIQIYSRWQAKKANGKVIVESFIEGQEVSIHALCNGRQSILFPPAQDHKQVWDGNNGPMTGGMGAIVPVPWVSHELMQAVVHKVIEPILAGLDKSGSPFTGCLYPGLKISPQGEIQVLEFNSRFGDPETQALMPTVKTDMFDLLEACAENGLDKVALEFAHGFAVCIVLASHGYPENPRIGDPIHNLDAAGQIPGVMVFHASTVYENDMLYTAGGRVLNITAVGDTLNDALDAAYEAANIVSFDGKHYRRDIGRAG